MGNFHSFKITGNPNSIEKTVLMDGKELKGVRAATICYEANCMPRVFLEFITTDIQVNDNLEVLYSGREDDMNDKGNA